jgi:hypothetical protein
VTSYNCGSCGHSLPPEMRVCPNCMHFQPSPNSSIRCAICHEACNKMVSFCYACGHGGHIDHMYCWFLESDECPTGCGCICGDVFREQEVLSDATDDGDDHDDDDDDDDGQGGNRRRLSEEEDDTLDVFGRRGRSVFYDEDAGSSHLLSVGSSGPASSAGPGSGGGLSASGFKTRERGFSAVSDADSALDRDGGSPGQFPERNRQWSGFRGLADFLATGSESGTPGSGSGSGSFSGSGSGLSGQGTESAVLGTDAGASSGGDSSLLTDTSSTTGGGQPALLSTAASGGTQGSAGKRTHGTKPRHSSSSSHSGSGPGQPVGSSGNSTFGMPAYYYY